MSKFYAVRKGRTPGVYRDWESAKREVMGFSGAEYKSFKTNDEALEFMNKNKKQETKLDGLIAYVDGSYDRRTKRAGFGAVIILNGEVIHEASKETKVNEADNLWNVSAEISGVLYAVEYAVKHNYSKIHVHYDYMGLEKWATNEWRANKETTKAYQEKIQKLMQQIEVDFIKVKAHTGDYYNERADDLAKEAIMEG